MANVKFTEFPSAATVGSTDIIPIVQGGLNKKATVAVFTTYFGSLFATLTGTQTLTNKTLTSPKINQVLDSNGNEILAFTPITSAVDYISIKNGIGVGVPLHISATGDSTNIGLHIETKGTGLVQISDGTDTTKGIRFRSSGSATSAVTLIDAVSSAGRVITLPNATGTLALTSDLSSYLPLAGGTLTGALNGTSASFNSTLTDTQTNASGITSNLVLENFIATNPAAGNGVAIDFRLNNSGNPTALLGKISLVNTFFRSNTDMIFSTALSDTLGEKMRLTSAGNVGIGNSAPFYSLDLTGQTIRTARIYSASTDTRIYLQNTTSGAPTTDAGLMTGLIVNDAYFFNYQAGNTIFGTNAAERMRITSSGALYVNQTTASAAGAGIKMQVATDMLTTGSLAGYFFEDRNGGVTASANWYGWYAASGAVFLYNGSANIASISGATGIYTPLSDVNKKKDFEASTIGLNEVLQLKPTLYRMKTDDESAPKELGFIAQEVKEFIPQAYVESGEEDSKFIGLNDRPIIAALVKAVQEQNQLILDLQARLNSLESK
jgi:hypothetical protein